MPPLASALGSGTSPIVLNGGILEIDGVSLDRAVSVNNGSTLQGRGNSAFNGTTTIALGAIFGLATVNPGDVFTIGNSPNDLTGGLGSGIAVGGPGKVVLAQPSNYGGNNWFVLPGSTLDVAADDRLGNASVDVTISNGTFLASGTFATARDFTAAGGAIGVTSGNTLTLSSPLLPAGLNILTTVGDGTLVLTAASTRTTSTIVQGGTLRLTNGSAVGSGTVTVNAGVLELIGVAIGAPVVNNNAVTVVGSVDFNGKVSGPGSFLGAGTAHFNGGLAPGASPANVSFEGNLALSNTNTLFIEIGGTTPGSQYDRLTIAGSASIDGNLNVTRINGFMPTIGQQFTILTAGSIVDNGFVLAGSAAGLFNLLVNSTSVILQVIGLPGDFNHDNKVDAADYVVWRKDLGTKYTQNDYDVWRAHFGQTAGSGTGPTASAAVPEPATLMFISLAAACGYLWRRRAA